jgi:hypothetical protein
MGKTNFIKYVVKEFYNKITFFELNFKTLMVIILYTFQREYNKSVFYLFIYLFHLILKNIK